MNLRPGSQIGPYTITREIARGGQGAVLEARDPSGAAVALKLLLDDDEESRARFLREAETLARLEHPNLIRVRDLGQTPGGVAYLALELVRGQSLADWVRGAGPPPPDEVRRVMASAAETLHYCHEQGLVHRDLKPQNLLLEAETGRVVVVDFGLVRRNKLALAWSTQDRASLTQEGAIMGTPAYMPPEQIASESGGVDRRSDVYGLGATLFFLLTGEAPFKGPGVLQLLAQVVDSPPPDPRSSRPDLPADLASLCLRSLAKDPGERPSTGLEFAEGLVAVAPSLTWRPLLIGAVALLGLAFGLSAYGASALLSEPSAVVASATPTPLASSPAAAPQVPSSPEDPRREAMARALRLLERGEAKATKDAEDLLTGLAEGGSVEAMFRLGLIKAEAEDPEARTWLEQATKANHTRAMLELGILYAKGRSVIQDRARARSLYQRAAEAGLPEGMTQLALCQLEGKGGETDLPQALRWLKRAADRDEPGAMAALGACALAGEGLRRDPERAFEWFEQAVAKGHTGAMIQLARLCRSGAGARKRDLKRATDLYRRAAEGGDAAAFFPYGEALLLGEGTPRDYPAAFKWFSKAAKDEDPAAMSRLGLLYYEGRPGVPSDPAAGVAWLEKAAARGQAEAMFTLGQALLEGKGIEQNLRSGGSWIERAAEGGELNAMVLFYRLLSVGRGVEVDKAAALKWIERAAEGGHAQGMGLWGSELRQAKEPLRAIPYLTRGAERGDLASMYSLASCYTRGEGVEKSNALAKKWFHRAAESAPDSPLGRRSKKALHLIESQEARKRERRDSKDVLTPRPKRP